MGLIGVLTQFGFDPEWRAKMARHKDTRSGVNWDELVESDHFEEYQSWQAEPVFHDIDYLVSFIGDGPKRARLWCVYRLLGHELVQFADLPKDVPWPWREETPHYHYRLERVPAFEPLEDQLVIEWSSERNWAQHLKDNQVLECPPLAASPFSVGSDYTRADVYELLGVPEDQRRGNWETGYNLYDGDLFIFCNVGSAGRSGHDYDNRWLDDGRFQWFAKERTHVEQKQIQWMLNPTGNILLFTREDNRQPFTFQGYCQPVAHENTTPVKILWRVNPTPSIAPPANYILANRSEIERRHYVRKADPGARYWFGFDRNKVEAYRSQFGDNFCLVLVGEPDVAGDFYCIPFRAIQHMLTDETVTEHKGGRFRWVGDVRQHRLYVTHYPDRLDIGQFYGVPITPGEPSPSDDVENDYAIENRIAEINQRVKQSVFRKRVLENFGGRCCICGVTEAELLVASHIVPWSQRIDSRLDPANGLCLFVLYDALFDAGYFTITEDLCVQTATVDACSDNLREALAKIAGKRIATPRLQLNAEYLTYHREHVFRG